MSRWRTLLFLVVGGALSLLFLYLSLRKVEAADAWAEISAVPLIALLVEPMIRLGVLVLAALRSRLVFRQLHRFSMRELFESVWLGFAINNVIPLRAGEVARIGYLARYGELPAASCLAAIALERVLDLLALVVIVLAVLPFLAGGLPLGASFYAVVVLVLVSLGAIVFVSRHPDVFRRACRACASLLGARVRDFVDRQSAVFAQGLSALGSVPVVMGVVAVTFLQWAGALGALQLWIWAFGLDLPWYAPAVILGFVAFGMAIPSTPGHVGTFHFFASAAVIYLGAPETQAVSFALVFHAMAVVPWTILALPLLLREYVRLQSGKVEPGARP